MDNYLITQEVRHSPLILFICMPVPGPESLNTGKLMSEGVSIHYCYQGVKTGNVTQGYSTLLILESEGFSYW